MRGKSSMRVRMRPFQSCMRDRPRIIEYKFGTISECITFYILLFLYQSKYDRHFNNFAINYSNKFTEVPFTDVFLEMSKIRHVGKRP